jgi:hypothetical protein
MLFFTKSISPPTSRFQESVQFFLNYHHETITEANYFRWQDYPKFCTKLMFAMSEKSDSLRFAMVSFSALVYSNKIQPAVRELAIVYYAKTLQELQLVLYETDMDLEGCFTAVATALQLSLFDVPFAPF